MAEELMPPVTRALAPNSKFCFTETGISLDTSGGAPSYEEWAQVTEYVRVAHAAVQFWAGDLVNIGEALFGEMASQIIDHEGWSAETVRAYAWVAAKIPPENRDSRVSFSHHQVVAALPLQEQVTWLDKAVTGSDGVPWSSVRLKQAIRQPNGTAPVEFGVYIGFESIADRDAVAQEHERAGRTVRRSESAKR